MKESPIFSKTYDLMAWLIPHTLSFPKSQRGVLARRLQSTVFSFYELLVDATLTGDPESRLREADAALTKLRTYLRLARDLDLMSIRQYGHVSQLVAEVGRLLGAWRRSANAREPSTGRNRNSQRRRGE
jgi:hypothetical protein